MIFVIFMTGFMVSYLANLWLFEEDEMFIILFASIFWIITIPIMIGIAIKIFFFEDDLFDDFDEGDFDNDDFN